MRDKRRLGKKYFLEKCQKTLDKTAEICYNTGDRENILSLSHFSYKRGLETMHKFLNEEIEIADENLDLLGQNPKDSALPDPGLMNFYRLAKERIFYIEYELERENLTEVAKFIMAINKADDDAGIPVEERKPIRLYIYSYGGEIDACIYFLNICKLSRTPIWTYNLAIAMSGGLVILLTGQRRFALKDSVALIHQGGQEGDACQGRHPQPGVRNTCVRHDILEPEVPEIIRRSRQSGEEICPCRCSHGRPGPSRPRQRREKVSEQQPFCKPQRLLVTVRGEACRQYDP